MKGYQGFVYVGNSFKNIKMIVAMLWSKPIGNISITNLTLISPVDKFRTQVTSVFSDSFVVEIERLNNPGQGWAQELWLSYFANGMFEENIVPPMFRSKFRHDARPIVLPLLRHLGGNFADADTLWNTLVTSHPNPRDTFVVEVGVADGTMCLKAANHGMNVFAIEPDVRYIKNPLLKNHENIRLIHAAAYSKDGYIPFSPGGTGGHISKEGSRVRSVTLDKLLRSVQNIYIVKIDVQGYEWNVLKGMQKLLAHNRVQYVILEYWPRGILSATGNPNKVLKLLNKFGYLLFDTQTLRLNKPKISYANSFRKPLYIQNYHDWYINEDKKAKDSFGSWTDIIAVAPSHYG